MLTDIQYWTDEDIIEMRECIRNGLRSSLPQDMIDKVLPNPEYKKKDVDSKPPDETI